MCRLFAQHASPAHDLHEPLCAAHNALRMQSHKHPHGWGIGWWDRHGIQVRRGTMPAHEDDAFVAAAREARSEIVIAHVRDASVGSVVQANTHPFEHGPWLFAHNGTIARFRRVEKVRAGIEAEIDAELRRRIRGETDSERAFFVFLSRLGPRCATAGGADLEQVRHALSDTVFTLARIADHPGEAPSSVNCLVSDGHVLVACRRGRTLHVAPDMVRTGIFAIASEPIGVGPWKPVWEDAFVGIDEDHRVLAGSLGVRGHLRRGRATGERRR